MQRFILLFLFITIKYCNLFGQLSKFDELSDKILFTIPSHKPDSSVRDFVKKYFPEFTEDYKPGGWTVSPPIQIHEYQLSVHSLIFSKHPYFDIKFKEGRLDILSNEEKNKPTSVRGFQVWFLFDTKEDAIAGFTTLSNKFDTLSKNRKILKQNGKTIAQYSGQTDAESSDAVLLILTKDELREDKYKVFFTIGVYKSFQ